MPLDERAKEVLVVDDSTEILEATSFLLEMHGCRVTCAVNGKEALEMLRSGRARPDVIVLDLMMPVMDGAAFRREQLKDERLARIPTIVATALSEASIGNSSELRFQKVISKPVVVDQLLAAINGNAC
jgi:CheY-like chemotaxis protein